MNQQVQSLLVAFIAIAFVGIARANERQSRLKSLAESTGAESSGSDRKAEGIDDTEDLVRTLEQGGLEVMQLDSGGLTQRPEGGASKPAISFRLAKGHGAGIEA